MHKEILTDSQIKLLPVVKDFSRNFYLVGGTAIALHIGHRRSIDFDLFSSKSFDNSRILKKLQKITYVNQVIRSVLDELTLMIGDVKLTFFHFDYPIEHKLRFDDAISLPNLLTLGAMKAYALGHRPKWKDYADLYFILKQYDIGKIADQAKKIFKQEFNEKLFRNQLAFFEDINYSEEVEFMPRFKVGDEVIKQSLVEASLS